MLHYAVVFLVIALIAASFGFGGIAAGAAGIAKTKNDQGKFGSSKAQRFQLQRCSSMIVGWFGIRYRAT